MSLLDTASLIVTPNGYKEGKLYSVIPSDGSGDLSVTRATTATRVNSAGLVELVPYNLVSYSEQFDNAAWTKYNATITANTNETTDPIGGNTADIFVSNNSTNTMGMEGNVSYIQNSIYTLTIYAKYKNTPFIQMLAPSFVSPYYVNFNIQTGAVVGGSYSLTPTITSVGNGWYRCSFTFVANYTGTTAIGATYLVNSASSTRGQAFTGDGVKGAYIWGAQVVEGSVAKDYQKTETRLNIPRLDYSNGTCPSILVEPQRTNLLTYSQQLQTATSGTITVTPNTATAPDGTLTADSLSSGYLIKAVSASTGTYTFSTYIKYLSSNTFTMYIYDGSYFTATYNVSTGVVTSSSAGVTASIEDAGNGWYRCIMTASTSTISEVGFNSGNVYAWGMQIEAGSYPTSYIPTTSASVTRNADVISKTGISSLIGQTEGTLFFDGVVNGCQNPYANLINSEKNTNTSFNFAYIKANKNIAASVFASGVEKARISNGVFEIGERVKIAYAYKSGDSALYVNGSLMGTSADTFTFPSTLDDIFIGDAITYFAYQEAITNNATAVWKTRLTNTQLAQLTTI